MSRTLILIFFLLSLIPNARAVELELHAIRPQDEELLRARLPELFTKTVNQSLLDQAIRLLLLGGTYQNVTAERLGPDHFALNAEPLRLIEGVVFRGNHGVGTGDLQEATPLKSGERFDKRRALAEADKLKNYYGEHGYFNAVIELTFENVGGNVRLVFDINERKPCLIKTLEFTTANTDLKKLADRHFAHEKNHPLSTERVRKLATNLNEYLVGEGYLGIDIAGPDVDYNDDKTEAKLHYEIKEPYRYEYYMSGYRQLTLTDLYHALDLDDRERKNVDPAGEGAERLRRGYLERGFPWVQIEIKTVTPPKTFLRQIKYVIKEGHRVRLKRIEVQGRISRPSGYYQDYVTQNSSPLIEHGFFNRQDLENGFKNLVTNLRNEGFLRARTLSSRVEFNSKRDEATVFLLLEEGFQTEIRALQFEGNKFFSSFELAKVTGLETNTALHLLAFEESLDKLKAFYVNDGFLEMKLLNDKEDLITYNPKGTEARILFRIYEGPRIRIRNIVVEGNTMTKTDVILREVNLSAGDVLTPKVIETATARLNRLGLFARAEIHTSDEGTKLAERTLVISVAERDPGRFNFGAGVTNERNFTVRGFAGTGYNNIGGTARAVSLRGELKENVGQINFLESEITGGYLEPFLFNTRTRGRVTVTRSEHVFDYEVLNTVTKITLTNRIDLLLERDLTLHTKLTWKLWGLESNKEFERYGRCIPLDGSFDPNLHCAPDLQQIATFGPTVDIDYRDSPFLPTRGSRFLLATLYSDPNLGSSSGVQFIRSEANYTHYTRLGSPRLVWANSLRGGYVSNLSRDQGSGVPTNYAFFLGGIYSVRGFDLATDSERIPRQDNGGFHVAQGNQKIIPKDSDYFLIKTELRFPIVGDHGGVVFYDGGDVFVRNYVFKRPYRDAIGLGYRYNTPVGPLALDVAFKISPQSDEAPVRFHLSIGTF